MFNLPDSTVLTLGSDLQGQMIVAKARVESLNSHLPENTTTTIIVDSIPGSALLDNCEYTNVLSGQVAKIIHADFVTSTSGTGLVHLAPGHGMDDYNVLTKLGIGPAFAPVDDQGRFTEKALPADPKLLQGLEVEKGGAKAVIALLRNPASKLASPALQSQSSLILATHNFKHKNPIDWRTKQPVIVRATEQWFADVGSIQTPALDALSRVDFIPTSGRSRLQSFLQGRSQWCISRQRAWGVPIPALFRVSDGQAVMTVESIDHIIKVIQERGSDAWWSDPDDDPVWISSSLEPGQYVRGKDTMDVWFDSGTTWTSISPRNGKPVSDVVIEGTDQHRGWFQSSLLTHVAQQDTAAAPATAPYGTVITHGFTLDGEGRKMSKSLGNVITPEEILSGSLLPPVKVKNDKARGRVAPQRAYKSERDIMGPDVLRLWVASSDYTKDVVIGQPVLHSVHQSLQKLRVTFKWILGCLDDYPHPGPATELLDDLYFSDQITLHQMAKTSAAVHAAFGAYEFHKGVAALNKFITADLSAFYFEVIKDRIYAEDVHTRAHTQTVLFIILTELLHMLTPVLPLLCEEVWAHLPAHMRTNDQAGNHARLHPLKRIWDEPFSASFDTFNGDEMDAQMALLSRASAAVKIAQEEARRMGRLGSGLACAVELQVPAHAPAAVKALLSDLEAEDELSELFVVSDATVVPIEEDIRKQLEEEEADDEIREFRALREDWRKSVKWQFEAEWECGTLESPATAKAVVYPPTGEKCARCWQWIAEEKDGLCGRCAEIVGEPGDEGQEGEEDEMDEEEEPELPRKYR